MAGVAFDLRVETMSEWQDRYTHQGGEGHRMRWQDATEIAKPQTGEARPSRSVAQNSRNSSRIPSSKKTQCNRAASYDKTEPNATPQNGVLTLVATPIGNLDDLSKRALDVLRSADLIICEDTRLTAKLLTAYNVPTPTLAFHDHNEDKRLSSLISRLLKGAHIALVSDAGTPLVADPGFRLTREAIAQGIRVTGIPGANAALLALTLSGLPPYPYTFLGFLPPRTSARRTVLVNAHNAEQSGFKTTYICYEAPHRLCAMLNDARSVFGDARRAAVGRELTKKFEEMQRGTLASLAAYFSTNPPRGELSVVIGPPDTSENTPSSIETLLENALSTLSIKDATALVASSAQIPRRVVYAKALDILNRKSKGSD